jgi:hypothetical protein
MIGDSKISLDFVIPVAAGADGVVDWYFEFTDDSTGSAPLWYREVAEENAGGGVVSMPLVVRTFEKAGGGALPAAATYYFSTQFERFHKIFRIQIRGSTGTFTEPAQVGSNYGLPVNAPS